jgi:hypothetical protein
MKRGDRHHSSPDLLGCLTQPRTAALTAASEIPIGKAGKFPCFTWEAVAAGRSLSSPFYCDAIDAFPRDFSVNPKGDGILNTNAFLTKCLCKEWTG